MGLLGTSPQGSTPDFSMQTPGGAKPQRGLWALFGLSAAICLAAGGALLAFLTGEFDPAPRPGAASIGQVLGTAISLCVLVASARVTAELEHRLRSQRPEAQALEAAHSARQARLRRHHHRFSPATMALTCLLFTCVAVALVALGIDSQASDARSAMVQGRGTRVAGIVQAVHNHQYCQAVAGGAGTSACIPRAEIVVRLDRPVGGVRTTTAHYPYLSFLRVGQAVTVLVDPRQPTYAELPGHRYRGAGGWILFAAAAGLLGLLALREGRALAQVLALRAQHRPRQVDDLVGS